ncbi:hypothetical protein ADK52_30945 [Streptomyces sp. WM6372]|uniref:hypothetical protein n=1 Tax=Streptomyces sp. WM6372 TaxID=1415555 RepID=UPI0006AF0185|nr:hypothetical protein [Streptomyces sp. WM6372]KOU18291.1 hypothetical protein ADK52_30945 [Streptomyces sp. WM6372]
MIKKTVRGMAVLAAAGVVWTGAASATPSATAGTATAGTAVGEADRHPGIRLGEIHDQDQDHDHDHDHDHCATTTAWGSEECPRKRLN